MGDWIGKCGWGGVERRFGGGRGGRGGGKSVEEGEGWRERKRWERICDKNK